MAASMKSAAFDMGATAMADGSAVVVGDTDLFIFNGTQCGACAQSNSKPDGQ